MNTEQLIAEACNLPMEQRAAMVDRLSQTFAATSPEIDQAWGELARQRRDALANGEVLGVPADLVFERIASRLQR